MNQLPARTAFQRMAPPRPHHLLLGDGAADEALPAADPVPGRPAFDRPVAACPA